MESLENIKIERLRETEVKGYDRDFKIVITQLKESNDGINIYKVCLELRYGRELFDIIKIHVTYDWVKSDSYFSSLESRYPEKRLTRKIF